MSKAITLLLMLFFISVSSRSQRRVVFFPDAKPVAENTGSAIKSSGFKKEMIYRYKKKEHNKDSSLLQINMYDTEGHIVQEKNFDNNDSLPYKITNYEYTNGQLAKKISMQQSTYKKIEIDTYIYDDSGNMVTQIDSVQTDFSTHPSIDITEKQLEYNADHTLSKIYIKMFFASTKYISNSFEYNNNELREIKNYAFSGDWESSYIFEFSVDENKQSIYRKDPYNTKLVAEIYFNYKKQIKELVIYSSSRAVTDRTTSYFEFDEHDLINIEKVIRLDDKSIFFKHYYFAD